MSTPEELMGKGKALLVSKRADYTTNSRYENFERQAELISWFTEPRDQAFVAVIAIKLARLGSLLGRNKIPNNESIEDTFVDLINYCSLWGGMRTSEVKVGNITFTDVPESDRLACEVIEKTKFLISMEIDMQTRDYLIQLVESRYRAFQNKYL